MRETNILDEIYNYVGRFVAFPDEKTRIAHTLWIAHTHLIEKFDTTPRLHIVSAEKRCGKTRLLDVTELLVRKPIKLLNPTPASLYTLIEQEHPTLLIDEVDRLFAKKDTSDITSITNSGFQRGIRVPRVILEPRKVEYFDVFGPMVLAGIDRHNMPDTITDRSITIRLKRRRDEKVEPFRLSKNSAEGHELRAKLALWAKSVLDKVKAPDFPMGIEDRNQDVWEPLFIVADVTDVTYVTDVTDKTEGWGDRARQAALDFSKEINDEEPVSNGELLLKDIYTVFDSVDKISTADLLSKLDKLSESPWSSYEYGKPISARGLARLLKPYGIKPKLDRFKDSEPCRGYIKASFEDAWSRYLPLHPDLPVTSVTSVACVTNRGTSSLSVPLTYSALSDDDPNIF